MRALKQRDIPVAGADRLILTEQLAVQDLVALGRFLLLPEDDLTLATVLRGQGKYGEAEQIRSVGQGRQGPREGQRELELIRRLDPDGKRDREVL